MQSPRQFWMLVAGFILLFGVSLLGYVIPVMSNFAFMLVMLGVSGWLVRRPQDTAHVLLAELALGGHGYLLRLTIGSATVSLRIGLFLLVLAIWLSQVLLQPRQYWRQILSVPAALRTAYVGLGLLVTFGVAQGLLTQETSAVFFDANAWIFLLTPLILLSTLRTQQQFAYLTQVIGAAVVTVAGLSLTLLIWFAHALPGSMILYRWIRDLRLGEITHVADTLYRIFLPSQIFGLVALATIGITLINKRVRTKGELVIAGVVLYLASLTLLISQSRSYWLAAVAMLVYVLVLAKVRYRLDWQRVGLLALLIAFVVTTQQSVINLAAGTSVGLGNRLTSIPGEAAGVSRINQLGPLAAAIQAQPLLGKGFGATVTYQSRDPRILQNHPDGWYTTSAFELGYLDVALKIGILGLVALLALIAIILWLALRTPDHGPWDAIAVGWSAALVGVAVTHIFSPYLNHPLGIGVLTIAGLAVVARASPTTTPALPDGR